MDLRWILLWSTAALCLVFPDLVISDPIKIDFNLCQPSSYQVSATSTELNYLPCCPILPTNETQLIYGAPPPSTPYTRVRLAAQCTDHSYAETLNRAYTLMRALPDDDPRSFRRQWELHCAYCGAAFYLINSTGGPTPGIDIHFSWLFYPWHRLYLFFHERILQSLLGDPTFSLSYWNWDSPYTVGSASTTDACLTVGHNFPVNYQYPNTAQYDYNRSEGAKGNGRTFPDLTFRPDAPAAQQPLTFVSDETLIQNNLGVMKAAMVTGATTTMSFVGRPYRAGDVRGNPSGVGGGGSLEQSAHAGAHFWTGEDPPTNVDMGVLSFSSRDPVFYSHHSNIDRLFTVWRDIGPQVGQFREYYNDPDFLNAEFQFWDENGALRTVPISDALDTVKLGYVYQATNDAAWINFNFSKCSNLSYADTITQAQALPAPVPDANGDYHLDATNNLILLVTVPVANGAELFLTVDGIRINRSVDTGFDVFLDLLNPQALPSPQVCSEYVGRFVNMASASGSWGPLTNNTLMWTQSVQQVLNAIGVPQPGPSTLVVTLAPLVGAPADAITFRSVTIENQVQAENRPGPPT